MKIRLAQGINLNENNRLATFNDAEFELRSFDEALRKVKNNIDLYDPHNSYSIVGAYTSIYGRVSSAVQEVIKAVDEISEYYLVDVVINQLTEDALAPEIGNNNIFDIKYPSDEKIEKLLEKLEGELGLDELILNITPDILKYGEYVLETELDVVEEFEDELNPPFDTSKGKRKVKKKNKGLIALHDVVEQGTVVGIIQGVETTGYLALTPDKTQIIKTSPDKFVKFVMKGSRKRIKLEEFIPQLMSSNERVQELIRTLPRFIRIGKSVIYPFINKFKEAELLEKLVPATKLSKLSNVNLVGVQVPPKYDINSGFEVSKRMENYINNKVGIDNRNGQITVESILSVAGRTKVLPLFGDKGSIEKLDYTSDEPDDLLGSVKDIREVIFDAIGVPSELIFKSDDENKGNVLRRNARYLRKLKNIQKTLAEGVKHIVSIHLDTLGVKYDYNEIIVDFRNKLVDVDNLDRMEHADTTVSFLSNIVNFFNDIANTDSPMAKSVDLNAVAYFLDDQLKTIGLADAILTQDEGGPEIKVPKEDEEEPDFNFGGDEEGEDTEDEDKGGFGLDFD